MDDDVKHKTEVFYEHDWGTWAFDCDCGATQGEFQTHAEAVEAQVKEHAR